MSIKCFLKIFAVAIAIQIALLILIWWAPDQGLFRYIDFVYAPWVWLVERLAGPQGTASHAFAGTDILGALIGLFGYSLSAGVVICYFKRAKS